jgi:hypothetical protein
MLHNQTFFVFLEIFAGGAKRRPVRFRWGIRSARRAVARLAVCQNEVSSLRFCFAQQKEFLPFLCLWYNKIVEVNQSGKRYFI